jgi:hypothetical protein
MEVVTELALAECSSQFVYSSVASGSGDVLPLVFCVAASFTTGSYRDRFIQSTSHTLRSLSVWLVSLRLSAKMYAYFSFLLWCYMFRPTCHPWSEHLNSRPQAVKSILLSLPAAQPPVLKRNWSVFFPEGDTPKETCHRPPKIPVIVLLPCITFPHSVYSSTLKMETEGPF